MGVRFVTMGCRLNGFESEVMRGLTADAGLDNAVVVNSCAVTAEAVRQTRQAVRRARRDDPGARIIVTGCAAQIDSAAFAAMPEVDRVLGNQEKMTADAFRFQSNDRPEARVQVNDIMQVREVAGHMLDGFGNRARAFVQIQQGCDHRCTFCVIPLARGNSRSVALGPLVEQVENLVAAGYREVVLTGVDITAYGQDLPGQPTLGNLVRRLLAAVPSLPRLRISSVDAVEMDPHLLRAFADEERLMPHVHLSLQAGADLILKRMKRRHLRRHAIDLCTELRRLRPDMAFGADFITGFPTETDAHYSDTLDLVDACDLVYLHVFPYSSRPGTPAARMPQVPVPVRKERARRLREKGQQRLQSYLRSLIGTRQEILLEKPQFGYSRHFAPVHLVQSHDGADCTGALQTIAASHVADGRLYGQRTNRET